MSSSTAEFVASLDDLLAKILLHLPVKSLVRFMSVSKRWKSLITGACFPFPHCPASGRAVGMFLLGRKKAAFHYIHLDVRNPSNRRFNELEFPDDPYAFWIHHACKGLLLCCSYGKVHLDRRNIKPPIRICYVLNPTLNLFVKLPRPGVTNGVPRFVLGVTLAFDPAKPPYKVVCVRGSEFAVKLVQVEVYSTESGKWSVAGEPFAAEFDFWNGVYSNGAVHWLHNEADELLFYNVDEDKFGKNLLPCSRRGIRYFGESNDKFHIVVCNYWNEITLMIYEMEKDRSGWFVKYKVHILPQLAAFRGRAYANLEFPLIDADLALDFSSFSVLRLVQGENRTSFLVAKIFNKVVVLDLSSYAFRAGNEIVGSAPSEENGFEKIPDFEVIDELEEEDDLLYVPCRAFEYIPSLNMFTTPHLC
ncbi:F-box protein At5g07610-like [Andrographis paniculata]|uniref:F-box protein At5g07610-like n=1 Tax=Andrographis paniculata TaxID=175694 RepID=UPI0021E6E5BC|nr:F-box protein At5g07610-like [Andrographis paniculata]XP_051137888.1 F-box protein At5g07610-like [Andrographis paniculata]XP_051137889.1 F-box protein At5g07610-like [Andrographis paniculata]